MRASSPARRGRVGAADLRTAGDQGRSRAIRATFLLEGRASLPGVHPRRRRPGGMARCRRTPLSVGGRASTVPWPGASPPPRGGTCPTRRHGAHPRPRPVSVARAPVPAARQAPAMAGPHGGGPAPFVSAIAEARRIWCAPSMMEVSTRLTRRGCEDPESASAGRRHAAHGRAGGAARPLAPPRISPPVGRCASGPTGSAPEWRRDGHAAPPTCRARSAVGTARAPHPGRC